MATTTSIDRLLLTELPTDLPWPPGAARQMWAVELKRDWKYLDTTDDVPGAWRGRMPTDLLVNGRLPLFNKEPGYMFFRGNNTAMVLFFKGTKKIPVVLPLSILNIGAKFRTLAEQTVELLPAPVSSIAPQTQSITQNNDSILERFIRTLWWTFATVPNQLRGLGATNEDLALCFGGQNLRQNVDAIYAAFIPDVLNVLKDGRFSLKNILDLRHVSPHWPGRPTIYLRVYTHPRGQPNGTYRDTSQADINHHVGFYVGKSILPWVRHRDHERRTDSCDGVYEGHYQIARKSRKEHRHMIPLMTFDERTPTHILKMAEQTMMIVLRTYHPVCFVPVDMNSKGSWVQMQCKAQFIQSVARSVVSAIGWPKIKPHGCNISSPMFELDYGGRTYFDCFPMVPGKASALGDVSARTFTTYRVRKSMTPINGRYTIPLRTINQQGVVRTIFFSFHTEVSRLRGPKPPDARFGYLVFEVMDDHKPHDRAWLGVPSVGQYVNFDEASCFSVRFEWFDEGQQTWLSMPMYRYYKGYTEMSGYAERLDVEKALAPWRLAMDVLQAIEGRVYTEPLDGFPERLSILHARKLEINHLAQKYRWVSRESRAPRPVPAYAIWDDNFRLIKRLFDTDLTHIATTEPYEKQSDVMNREAGDQRRVKGVHKCDTCTYMGVGMKCIRDERRTDVWASRFSQHPTGPHRFLAYHNSMTPAQLCEATRVPVPLPEHLLEEAEGEEEGSGDDAQGDGDLGSGEE
ncbi:hypothetical protein NW765_013499 [Fusarium oxysporum]|uniref:Uncharacterized protein n=1 Tax=Fusarium oxysporum Fo47 TaxID=660027 RepID=W9KCN1_FUSOX|nr:hypothetical protein FOZG_09152 [Fusarium oxysporum Fo47]KAJ4151967.1 hypothetical protein NW765_013499 [Fusarium oxysporum]KAJ4285063.1 hypothetical protein NW764_000354 [Fusarium oxysporum]